MGFYLLYVLRGTVYLPVSTTRRWMMIAKELIPEDHASTLIDWSRYREGVSKPCALARSGFVPPLVLSTFTGAQREADLMTEANLI